MDRNHNLHLTLVFDTEQTYLAVMSVMNFYSSRRDALQVGHIPVNADGYDNNDHNNKRAITIRQRREQGCGPVVLSDESSPPPLPPLTTASHSHEREYCSVNLPCYHRLLHQFVY